MKVQMLVEFEATEEELEELRPEHGWREGLDYTADDLQADLQADWPGKNHRVTVLLDVKPEPVGDPDLVGHAITLVAVNLTEKNDLAGTVVTCACGKRWGIDGQTARKPFRNESLAKRAGDLHLYRIKNKIPEE